MIDLSGAFLHQECGECVLMIMEGRMTELMAMTESKIYREYVTKNSKRKSILYVKLQQGLYKMLKDTFLFYTNLLSNLFAQGFMPTPYDPCKVNKIVDGK